MVEIKKIMPIKMNSVNLIRKRYIKAIDSFYEGQVK